MIKRLSVDAVKYSAHSLAIKSMSWNEPIPEFSSRFSNILESCINAPYQRYGGKDLYKGLIEKAAILFYLMIKNHPFQNGNKRIAVTTLLLFLYINNKWIKVDNTELYNLAVWIAQSPSDAKDEMVIFIFKFIKKHIFDL
ncbi:type II toxin-antitoxin system death-on-curing family toxin [Candidatus Parcubacteria bacterium]|nr:type II toxin-antitoxin system death-on-curing family toxin [Candidatus Parcubacteria bacterium]